jgi:hypothetical protein
VSPTPRHRPPAASTRVRRLACLLLVPSSLACATLPRDTAERSLYLDLRKIVDTSEEGGWTVDSLRLEANLEPALRSTCEVDRTVRAELDAWLSAEITRAGGPAEQGYLAHGRELGAVRESLALERTRRLLRYAEARAAIDCPFWLRPAPRFAGVQGDFQRWVVLGETQAFGTVMVPGPIPALGGGGRLFLGRGLTPRGTLALGADLAASGTLLPGDHGIDAYVTFATPVLYRFAEFSQLWDVELAPVMRFSHARQSWPPGGRIEVAGGFSSVTLSPFMSYFMFYVGYELHGVGPHEHPDHTFQLGTRIAVDWAPSRD